MKRAFYFSGTLLCLSLTLLIGFHLGVQKAEADFNPSGFIVGGISSSDAYVLTSNGEMWKYQNPNGPWVQETVFTVPMATSSIKLWMLHNIVTTSDEVWQHQGETWVNIGTPPGGVVGVPTNPTTWGQLKNKYQEDDQ